MKKIIVLFLFVFQILWIFNSNSISLANKRNIDTPSVIEVRGYLGLVKIVCSNFLEYSKKVVEVSCTLFGLLDNNQQEKPKEEETQTDKVAIIHYNQFNFSETIKRLISNSEWLSFIYRQFLQNIECLPHGIYSWLILTFIFLYLHRLKVYFLNPRASIDHILSLNGFTPLDYNLSLTELNKNPNWMLGITPCPIRVFFIWISTRSSTNLLVLYIITAINCCYSS